MANNKTNDKKLPLSIYLSEKGISYDSGWEKIYPSNRTFYRRNQNPTMLLFTEAVKLAHALNISLEQLIDDLVRRGIIEE